MTNPDKHAVTFLFHGSVLFTLTLMFPIVENLQIILFRHI
ncbi:hypothetical protein BN1221_01113c [Brenneria goodwinii]|uniref:Uncharacterized protein n=1 Tax=Brenneria goodwinii TaxID=1109412 RepID=A0A0G4JRZ8_9GAMM|nr:hypothetical protein BN1221_01113c [Brenneria goodwinii]